jgi:hypothetical protein
LANKTRLRSPGLVTKQLSKNRKAVLITRTAFYFTSLNHHRSAYGRRRPAPSRCRGIVWLWNSRRCFPDRDSIFELFFVLQNPAPKTAARAASPRLRCLDRQLWRGEQQQTSASANGPCNSRRNLQRDCDRNLHGNHADWQLQSHRAITLGERESKPAADETGCASVDFPLACAEQVPNKQD